MTQARFDAITQVAVVITEGNAVDLIEDYTGFTAQHVADLRDMGYKVRVKLFPNWDQAQAYADKLGG